MKTAYVRVLVDVLDVEPYKRENHVTLKTTTGNIEMFVDDDKLRDGALQVELVNTDDDQALVELPAEPLWGGRRVVVALDKVIYAV